MSKLTLSTTSPTSNTSSTFFSAVIFRPPTLGSIYWRVLRPTLIKVVECQPSSAARDYSIQIFQSHQTALCLRARIFHHQPARLSRVQPPLKGLSLEPSYG